MGTLLAVYSEKKRRFFSLAAKHPLDANGLRRVLASPYRYCVGGEFFYIPVKQDGLEPEDRLCWVRDRDYMSIEALNEAVSGGSFDNSYVRIGNTYLKRRAEREGKFVEVENFVSQALFESISSNPETLSSVSKDDFEALCAEIFVRRGFEVDLYRSSKDGGIDFVAVKNEDLDPTIFAVQCKHPDERDRKRRKSLGSPVMQQIYGAAKAWDLKGAVAISSATYTPDAARFAANKPDEMLLYDSSDLLGWIEKYRWNTDE